MEQDAPHWEGWREVERRRTRRRSPERRGRCYRTRSVDKQHGFSGNRKSSRLGVSKRSRRDGAQRLREQLSSCARRASGTERSLKQCEVTVDEERKEFGAERDCHTSLVTKVTFWRTGIPAQYPKRLSSCSQQPYGLHTVLFNKPSRRRRAIEHKQHRAEMTDKGKRAHFGIRFSGRFAVQHPPPRWPLR